MPQSLLFLVCSTVSGERARAVSAECYVQFWAGLGRQGRESVGVRGGEGGVLSHGRDLGGFLVVLLGESHHVDALAGFCPCSCLQKPASTSVKNCDPALSIPWVSDIPAIRSPLGKCSERVKRGHSVNPKAMKRPATAAGASNREHETKEEQ